MLLYGTEKACAGLLPKPQSQHSDDVMAALSCPMLPLGCELVYAFPHFILSPMSQGLSLHLTGEYTPPSPLVQRKVFPSHSAKAWGGEHWT